MAFCGNCGRKIEEGIKYCAGCGKAVSGIPEQVQQGTVMIQQQPIITQAQTVNADEKYCSSCGAVIKKIAELCPKCGVKQGMQKNKDFNAFTKNIENSAISCLVFGILGLIAAISAIFLGDTIFSKNFGWLNIMRFGFPALGVVIYISQGRKSTKKSIATAGLILSIVGCAISLVMLIMLILLVIN